MRKEKKRRLLSALVCGSMLAVALVGGTFAYLTSEDSDVNVMTLGGVEIMQHEYQRADGVAHNAGDAGVGNGAKEGDLVPFAQGQQLMPAVPKGDGAYTAEATDLFYWGDYVYSGTAGNGLWNDDKLANQMDKMVFVENTGKSDAYVRTLIAFECPEGMEYSQGSDKEFMMNINASETAYKWEEVGYITVDGVRYLVMDATYLKALAPGNTSHPSLLQVVMTHNATNEDMDLLGDTYEILVLSQAVQTEGFADAKTALDTAFGEANATTVADWFGGMGDTKLVASDEELKAALTADKKVITVVLTEDATYDLAAWDSNAMGGASTEKIVIDGAGHTLTFNNTNSDWSNVVVNGAELVINNATITNSGHDATSGTWNAHDIVFNCDVELNNVTSLNAIAVKGNAKFYNVKISDDSTDDAYMLWIQPNGQTVVLDGCTIDASGTGGEDRGIKIDEQYVDAPKKVTLKVTDTVFTTEKKAAILVKSSAGADISLKGIDIAGVAADTVNAVWVDSASASSYDSVKVSGGTKHQES